MASIFVHLSGINASSATHLAASAKSRAVAAKHATTRAATIEALLARQQDATLSSDERAAVDRAIVALFLARRV